MFCTQCGTQYDGGQCPACATTDSVASSPNYQVPNTQISSPGNAQIKYAGWWKRAFASIIDGLILVPVLFILGGLLSTTSSSTITASIIGFVVEFLYLSQMWLRKDGQTVGAKAMGIRVVAEDGAPLSRDDAYRRAAVYQLINISATIHWVLAPLGIILAVVNVFFPLWDPKNQTLHDKAAKTIVIEA